MGDFTFRRMTTGNVPELDAITNGTTALEDGDIASIDGDGLLAKVTDGSALEDLVLVLGAADASEANVPVIWLDNTVVIEGTFTGTLGDVGDKVAIRVATNVITVEPVAASQPAQFVIRRIIDATAKTVELTRFTGDKVT